VSSVFLEIGAALLLTWTAFTIGEGIATGKVRKVSRYDFELYDRKQQPVRFWTTITIRSAMAALFGWMLLAYCVHIFRP